MKFAVISDTHFGDPMSGLVEPRKASGYKLGTKYTSFRRAAGRNDFLILLGDIFDFSIEDYARVYEAAKVFFTSVAADGLAKAIIYVPGNHDFEFWHLVEYEVNVIQKMQGGKSPRGFRWSVPGVIDDRKNSRKRGFVLPGVTRQRGTHPYGGLFLDQLTGGAGRVPFFVAYPNVYIVTDSQNVMMTHGHYLEAYWSLLSETAPKVFRQDLQIGEFLDLAELVSINFPLNQLASSGVGQAGCLTDLIRSIQRDVKDKKLDKVKTYLERFDDAVLDVLFDYKRYDPREWISDTLINKGRDKLLEALKKRRETRYSEQFVGDPQVQERFKRYYLASIAELEVLNEQHGFNKPSPLQNPTNVIIGHTHRPITWKDRRFKMRVEGTTVRIHNTGGWLFRGHEDDGREFVGAEIFLYDKGKMSSVRVD